MRPCFARAVLLALLIGMVSAPGFASPSASTLLSLVPTGSEIVAGLENRHCLATAGHLFLTTRNNRLDLEDWIALAGVDTEKIFNEVIEVAASPSGGALTEHLLLVAGTFDGKRIFQAAQQNGAQTTEYLGEKILVIKPFAREQGNMLDTRWLAIRDNKVAMFGTQGWVQLALQRYVRHALPDPTVEERLTLLRPDVTSWNLLMPSSQRTRNIAFAQSQTEWARLMEGAEVFMVGVHFGPSTRVDFSIFAKDERGEAYFTQKAALFRDLFVEEATLRAGLSQAMQARLENVNVGRDRAEGSFTMSSKQFGAWSVQLGLMLSAANKVPAPIIQPFPATE